MLLYKINLNIDTRVMTILICSLVTKLYQTLCNNMDFSLPCSSVHGISQARILEWVVISFSGGIFLTQGLNPCLLCLLLWKADSLPLSLLIFKYHCKPNPKFNCVYCKITMQITDWPHFLRDN